MPAEIEWVTPTEPEPDPGAPRPGASRPGPRRPARWVRAVPAAVRWLAAAALVTGLLVVFVRAQPTGPGPVPSVTPHATPTYQPPLGDPRLALVRALAGQPGPLVTYVRPTWTSAGCPAVRVGHSPQRVLVRAVREALPDYTVRDTAATLDQSAGLCTLDLRAADPHGSTAVVEVAAPQHPRTPTFTELSIVSESSGRGATSAATAVLSSGWSVTVGVVGPLDDQPSSATLLGLAQDEAVLW